MIVSVGGAQWLREQLSGSTRTRALVSSPPTTARPTSSSITPPSRLTVTAASRRTSGLSTPPRGARRARRRSRFARSNESTAKQPASCYNAAMRAVSRCPARRLPDGPDAIDHGGAEEREDAREREQHPVTTELVDDQRRGHRGQGLRHVVADVHDAQVLG